MWSAEGEAPRLAVRLVVGGLIAFGLGVALLGVSLLLLFSGVLGTAIALIVYALCGSGILMASSGGMWLVVHLAVYRGRRPT